MNIIKTLPLSIKLKTIPSFSGTLLQAPFPQQNMRWGNVTTLLPFAFQGLQEGTGSWFRADSKIDSTNGHSWCGFPYRDSSPLFAPDLQLMSNGTNAVYPDANWYLAGKQYCGLEAKVYNADTQQTIFLYVGDAFDHRYVNSPGSIDIMINSYSVLFGSYATDKNLVIKNLQWEFTGSWNPQYKFGGTGDPY